MPISAQQSRGARGLLNWKLSDLAVASGLGLSTIKHFEVSVRRTTPANLIAIRAAFEKAGVIFESEGKSVGVKLKLASKGIIQDRSQTLRVSTQACCNGRKMVPTRSPLLSCEDGI
jgi:hypothetical protein